MKKLLIFFGLLSVSSLLFAQKAEKLLIPNKLAIPAEVYYGTRTIPGYNIVGTYIYKDNSDQHPIVQLNADGTGIFEKHDKVPVKIKWWIYSDADGTPKMNKGEVGQQHTIIVQYLEPQYVKTSTGMKEQYAKDEFDMMQLTIRYDEKKMYILGEREKAF